MFPDSWSTMKSNAHVQSRAIFANGTQPVGAKSSRTLQPCRPERNSLFRSNEMADSNRAKISTTTAREDSQLKKRIRPLTNSLSCQTRIHSERGRNIF